VEIPNIAKKVYLDTNIWIELERAQSDDNSSRRQALEHVLNQARNGLLCFPLSYIHCQEMTKHGDVNKRRSLWGFATHLSSCCAMLNKQSLLPLLIQEAVNKVFNIRLDREPVEVFTRSGLFGIELDRQYPPPELLLMNTEYGWNHFWLDMPDNIHECLFEVLRKQEEDFIQRRSRLKINCRTDSYDSRKRAYAASLLFQMQDEYISSLHRLGKKKTDIDSLTMEDRIRLVTEVPPLDVEISLSTQHQQQWDRPEETNDIRDINHLCMAIPYCDVVITERYWVDKIQREKLDKKYGTQVSSDLSFLLQL
jgi:hypothetical protein